MQPTRCQVGCSAWSLVESLFNLLLTVSASVVVTVLVNCVTPQTVCVIKAIIALCFLVIGLCLTAVLFDVVVFSNRCMKVVRHHAILSILAGWSVNKPGVAFVWMM